MSKSIDSRLWMVDWQIENGEKEVSKAINMEIERAEYLVEQLKSRKKHIEEIKKIDKAAITGRSAKIEDILQWGMNDISNYTQNVKLQSIMEMLGGYKSAKAVKEYIGGLLENDKSGN